MDEPRNVSVLRSSCDWCRAQKLRCVSSTTTDATAPCQRCLKSKPPRSCVFSKRSRSGRSASASTGDSSADKGKDKSALPGMSTFTLSVPASTPPDLEAHFTLDPPPGNGASNSDGSADSGFGEMADDSWKPEYMELDSLDLAFLRHDDTMFPGGAYSSATGITTPATNIASFDFADSWLSPTDTAIDHPARDARPDTRGPVVDLTALLADMTCYENQLLRLSGELDNYPIGDALFFSHRFRTILSENSHPHSAESSPLTLDLPAMLLILSCYMTLTRIYSSILDHLREHLSQLQDTHSSREAESPHNSFTSDINSYRGLRLGQLQPLSMHAGRALATRARKAVSMLLDSLGGSEGMLGLSSDVRIINSSRPDSLGEGSVGQLGMLTSEKTILFKEGVILDATNGRLYKTIRRQAVELQGKVEEVDDLLRGLLQM
ncbi:hypothetical protein PCL_08615 [Purpureocillium lilacinum]|uniref:Zn(2)-C6 fungal-type domain-containing protein n=1 Tax=Purpureocillium lilacinum TaxID=33203 RepID=A0A2U3DR70_PURLI|nr:hypothetical protein PCL_08615 [Purpureocillium lilacinum]